MPAHPHSLDDAIRQLIELGVDDPSEIARRLERTLDPRWLASQLVTHSEELITEIAREQLGRRRRDGMLAPAAPTRHHPGRRDAARSSTCGRRAAARNANAQATLGRMEYGILGPLAAWQNGRELELGTPQQRALLAVFLLHAGELMSLERLAPALWGERPPATAVKVLQVNVSRLRQTLGDGVVETRRSGYVLQVEDDSLDSRRFERLLAEGQRLLREGTARQAGAVLREGLALWRGEPLADLCSQRFVADEIARLEELRFMAVEQRLEADVACGRHLESVPELESLVRRAPLREGLRRLLMLALYRSGRQADALMVMQDIRRTLRDELGLRPSQALQRLEKAILVQDPVLDPALQSVH